MPFMPPTARAIFMGVGKTRRFIGAKHERGIDMFDWSSLRARGRMAKPLYVLLTDQGEPPTQKRNATPTIPRRSRPIAHARPAPTIAAPICKSTLKPMKCSGPCPC